MKNYKDYSDFMKSYENHRDRHEARTKLNRTEGFEELNDKYGSDYEHRNEQDNPNSPMNENYNIYRERYYERYWDTKANHDYYS